MQAYNTILLKSRTHTNLCLELELSKPRASMSLRRRHAQQQVTLMAGKAFDMCKNLDIGQDEALDVLNRSPQVQRYIGKGLLTIIKMGPKLKPTPATATPAPLAIVPDPEPTPALKPEPEPIIGPSMRWNREALAMHATGMGVEITAEMTKRMILEQIESA